MGERLLCKQEAVGSIPSGSTNERRVFWTSVACYLERTQEAAGSIPSSATRSYRLRCDSVQLCVSWKCKAESCSCSLTIREGKAHSGLMRSRMRRVELYLARTRETKGAGAGGANTLVTVVLGDKGPRLWGQATKCM